VFRYLWGYYFNTDVPTEKQSGGKYFTANDSGKKMSNMGINKKGMRKNSIFILAVKEFSFFSF